MRLTISNPKTGSGVPIPLGPCAGIINTSEMNIIAKSCPESRVRTAAGLLYPTFRTNALNLQTFS